MKKGVGLNKVNVIMGAVVAGIGAYFVWAGRALPSPVTASTPPGLFPQIVGGLLVLLGIILTVRELLRYRRGASQPQEVVIQNARPLLIAMALTLAYPFLMKPVGFVVMTFLYLAVMFYNLEPVLQKLWIKLLVSAVFTALLYVVFGMVFRVSLPEGLLI